MIRRSTLLAFLLAASAVLLCAAGLPQQWRSWRYSRSVSAASSTQTAPYAEIPLPWDLIARCREIIPSLRTILYTGHACDPSATGAIQPDAFLRKPFLPKELLTTVQSVLAQ